MQLTGEHTRGAVVVAGSAATSDLTRSNHSVVMAMVTGAVPGGLPSMAGQRPALPSRLHRCG